MEERKAAIWTWSWVTGKFVSVRDSDQWAKRLQAVLGNFQTSLRRFSPKSINETAEQPVVTEGEKTQGFRPPKRNKSKVDSVVKDKIVPLQSLKNKNNDEDDEEENGPFKLCSGATVAELKELAVPESALVKIRKVVREVEATEPEISYLQSSEAPIIFLDLMLQDHLDLSTLPATGK